MQLQRLIPVCPSDAIKVVTQWKEVEWPQMGGIDSGNPNKTEWL